MRIAKGISTPQQEILRVGGDPADYMDEIVLYIQMSGEKQVPEWYTNQALGMKDGNQNQEAGAEEETGAGPERTLTGLQLSRVNGTSVLN
jgi:hypothetical protein